MSIPMSSGFQSGVTTVSTAGRPEAASFLGLPQVRHGNRSDSSLRAVEYLDDA